MSKRKDDDAVDVEKGDIKLRVKFKAIICAIILVIILIVGAIVLYSNWKLGPFSHDADDVPKPKIGHQK